MIKEFLFGTPAEREAIKQLKEYKKMPHLTSTERHDKRRREIRVARLRRRQGVAGSVALAAAAIGVNVMGLCSYHKGKN